MSGSASVQIVNYIDRVFDDRSETERAKICTALVKFGYKTVGTLPFYDESTGWDKLENHTGLDPGSVQLLRNTTRAGLSRVLCSLLCFGCRSHFCLCVRGVCLQRSSLVPVPVPVPVVLPEVSPLLVSPPSLFAVKFGLLCSALLCSALLCSL